MFLFYFQLPHNKHLHYRQFSSEIKSLEKEIFSLLLMLANHISVFFLIYVCMYFSLFCLCVHLCITCVPGISRGQKQVLDLVELEQLQMIVIHYVDIRNLIMVFWKSNQYSQSEPSLQPHTSSISITSCIFQNISFAHPNILFLVYQKSQILLSLRIRNTIFYICR